MVLICSSARGIRAPCWITTISNFQRTWRLCSASAITMTCDKLSLATNLLPSIFSEPPIAVEYPTDLKD
jgi:hypothetical protein